jgi:acyl-coenzyme A synthetase/AMP-(fatty) acid ligase
VTAVGEPEIRKFRAALVADPELGAGNALVKVIEHGAALDGPGITFDVDVDGHPAWEPLSLGALRDRVAARASWLHSRGVGPRDAVAVYVTSSADILLNFMALTWLGAVPALMNGNIPGDIGHSFIRRLRAAGAVTDAAHRESLSGLDIPVYDAAELGTGDPGQAPAHYRHDPADPVAITHSSGTTRIPAAVVHSHASVFAAVRRVHLEAARAEERTLSVMPAAHAAGIISLQLALCNRHELLFMSAQGGPFRGSAEVVLDAIERWRPTGVYGFAVTWSEMARHDLTKRDLNSVRMWFNTGDSAHEAHIRPLVAAGSHLGYSREHGTTLVPGSKFIDGIGSSEMGHSGFRAVHTSTSSRYGRCVGKPYDFADMAIFDLDDGSEVPAGKVGQVGMKSPTLALGYWNDSVSTYRTRYKGYYLTGDLMYRDADGYYYHMDRLTDAVDLGDGDWLYTAMSEERIMAQCPDVHDCTVIAGRVDGEVATDVFLQLAAGADPDADRGDVVRAALGGVTADGGRAAATLRHLVAIPDDQDDAMVYGATGKVRKFLMRQRYLPGGGTHATGTWAAGTRAAGVQ